MPKYYNYKVYGYFLYFTAKCIVECMHVHASDTKLTEERSAKFFVKENGDTIVQQKGSLSDVDIRKLQSFIKNHYKEMYEKWAAISEEGFYQGR